MPRPDLQRVPEYYHKYIQQTVGNDLVGILEEQASTFPDFMASIPEDKHLFSYAPGKWTLKDLYQHIIDGERVFAYRALRFARQDSTPLPGFEENDYAVTAHAAKRDWKELGEEFKAVRAGNIFLFKSFGELELESGGIASDNPTYVRAIGFILAGHVNHHRKIIEERYLS